MARLACTKYQCRILALVPSMMAFSPKIFDDFKNTDAIAQHYRKPLLYLFWFSGLVPFERNKYLLLGTMATGKDIQNARSFV